MNFGERLRAGQHPEYEHRTRSAIELLRAVAAEVTEKFMEPIDTDFISASNFVTQVEVSTDYLARFLPDQPAP